MNDMDMIEYGPDMITIPLTFTQPDGQLGVGWATVAPDVSEATKDALRALMAAASQADVSWTREKWMKGDPLQ